MPVTRLSDMLLDPGGTYEFDGAQHRYPDIRMVYWAGGNPFHHHQDLNKLTEAWRRPETIVVHEPWWTPTARMADIMLPATTTLERDDIAASSKDPYLVAMKRTVDPPGEARSDREIFAALAARLGVEQEYTDGDDDQQALRAMYERARESAREHGHPLPDFETFWERGHHRYELPDAPPPFAGFRRAPEEEPLATPSGRIELFSETIDRYGYDECPGHPVWLPAEEWSGASDDARFPIHLLSPQPSSRLHSQLDMGAVSTESKVAGREPIVLNADDAAARGISAGDVVRIWNDRGETRAGATLSEEVLAGVALLATGAWFTPAEPGTPGSPEQHGNPNVLTRDVPTSRLTQGPTAQSVLVEVEAGPAGEEAPDPHRLPEFTAGPA